ncbi:cytochrome b [Pseudomonas fluorescens]|uniref:Cytochrome b n=2 Tax=Pseudomonas fluorescens TaxID=294 RepID=A0A327N986_PSEFL|nr:cytochrome b [Pseudomonas fluorescens]
MFHWLMAIMVLSTLFVGVGMTSSLQWRPLLLNTHLLLGVSIFALVIVRIVNRLTSPSPGHPEDFAPWQALGLALAHLALYALMTALPLVGWALLSAGGYPMPTVLGWALPPLVKADPQLYSILHQAHEIMAYGLFGLILIHLAAALVHAWIKKDGVFSRMTIGSQAENVQARAANTTD